MNGDLSLRFRLFGFPVQVSALFVLMAVILGGGESRSSALDLVAWVGIVFVSVLLHELGHAFTARAYGQSPVISLHGMGGLTSWLPRVEMGAGRRLMVALAGPVAGLTLGVVAALVGKLLTLPGTEARALFRLVATVNLSWGVLNLIPMLPLDGGNVMASLFELVAPGRGTRAARYISIVMALAVGAGMVALGDIWVGLLCALFVYTNVLALRQPSVPPSGAVIDVEAQPVVDEPPARIEDRRRPGP